MVLLLYGTGKWRFEAGDHLNIHLRGAGNTKTHINDLDIEKVLDYIYFGYWISLCIHVDSKSQIPFFFIDIATH